MSEDRKVPPAPTASSPGCRRVMVANSRRGTRPQLALRSELHRRGLRFRVERKIGTGRSAPRPDVSFSRERIAVFVDGCYWHGCAQHGVRPSTNSEYWHAKIDRNRMCDLRNSRCRHSFGTIAANAALSGASCRHGWATPTSEPRTLHALPRARRRGGKTRGSVLSAVRALRSGSTYGGLAAFPSIEGSDPLEHDEVAAEIRLIADQLRRERDAG